MSKKDNSSLDYKILLRTKYLPENARVLDLFCGNGEMYKKAYRGHVHYYRGIDKEKVHDTALCEINDNLRFIRDNDLKFFNVFDLDDYGSPWKQLYLIVRKLEAGEYTFFITDGLVLNMKLANRPCKFSLATEKFKKDMSIPGINRFYTEMFATMLQDLEKRYNCKVKMAKYLHNEGRTVYYWAIKIQKQEKTEEKRSESEIIKKKP